MFYLLSQKTAGLPVDECKNKSARGISPEGQAHGAPLKLLINFKGQEG